MNTNNRHQTESQILEKIKWLSIFILFIVLFSINYHFYTIQMYLRLLIIFILSISIITTLMSTKKGKWIISYVTILNKEIKKIIWPKYKDTFYTTLIVITITIFMSLILWALDNIIFRLVAFIISLRF